MVKHNLANSISSVTALDELGQICTVQVAKEVPLTLLVDDQKMVTLMTLGIYPKALAIGYLRNQRIIKALTEIESVQMSQETIQVNTFAGIFDKKTYPRPITTGCGQGAVLDINQLSAIHLPKVKIKQSLIYTLLHTLTQHNDIHQKAGGVHACALCQDTEILAFVEDVGRHNAVDTISGLMWLHNWLGKDKIFYTTGRLTSEIVTKVAHINIPILLSRSGVTYKGIQVAQAFGITLIAHAKNQRFLVFNGEKNIVFDACPSS